MVLIETAQCIILKINKCTFLSGVVHVNLTSTVDGC